MEPMVYYYLWAKLVHWGRALATRSTDEHLHSKRSKTRVLDSHIRSVTKCHLAELTFIPIFLSFFFFPDRFQKRKACNFIVRLAASE